MLAQKGNAATIAFFCSVSSFDTGMPISTFKLIEHFAAQESFRVYAIFPENGEFPDRAMQAGASVEIIPFARLRSPKHMLSFLKFLISFLPACFRIYCFLKKRGIQLIHFSDFIDAPFFPVAFFAGATRIAHLRYSLENRISQAIYRIWISLFVQKVICISQAVGRFSGIPVQKINIIYNPGPDPKLFNPQYPRHKKKAKLIQILAIAKFLPVKGHDNVVEIAGRVYAQIAGKARFVIIGDKQTGYEDFYDRIKAKIQEKKLKEHFEIRGQIAHEMVVPVFASSDVFVHFPSYQEGLGGVILEAMMMGVPVVAFDSGGVRECFTHEKSGFLVPQFDYEEAAARIAALIENPDLRKRMGEEAKREVRQKFSYEKHFRQIEAVYRNVLGKSDTVYYL
jgi:glycosyltransferase involved in cell wall biosynthesis